MNSTQSLEPLRCIECNHIIGYVHGDASLKCPHDKTVTLYINGIATSQTPKPEYVYSGSANK